MTISHSHRAVAGVAGLAVGLLLAGCTVMDSVGLAPNKPDPEAVKLPAGTRTEPEHVVVRHVLVSFEKCGILSVTRTEDEAKRLAQRVFDMAKSGHDFGELVRLYSDDRHGDGDRDSQGR